jgi:hypothetical protein
LARHRSRTLMTTCSLLTEPLQPETPGKFLTWAGYQSRTAVRLEEFNTALAHALGAPLASKKLSGLPHTLLER